IRKRPRSSVATSLANFVGRSVVSAITQTPASGPLGPVTTPPMSFAPTLPVPGVLWHAARSAARAAATTPRYKAFLVFMNPPFGCGRAPQWKSDFPVRHLPEPMPFRAPECTFPSISASRVGSRRIGGPSVQCGMLSLVFGTIAFFVASYFIRRYLNEIGIPKTLVRGLVVFVLALAAAYGVAFIVDWVAGPAG